MAVYQSIHGVEKVTLSAAINQENGSSYRTLYIETKDHQRIEITLFSEAKESLTIKHMEAS